MKQIIALLIIIFASLAFAGPPELPTTLYGRVLNADGSPAAGVEVTASWIDSDGKERTTVVKTLTQDQASGLGNPGLAGFYLFNHGLLKARDTSLIEMTVEEHGASIESRPGGNVVRCEDIVLTVASRTPGAAHAAAGEPGAQGSGDSGGGESSGAVSGGSDSSGSWHGTSDTSNRAQPGMPTTLYGQLLDGASPAPGETVIAEWTDPDGNLRTAQTKTLTKEEAKSFGYEGFEGFYFFNRGDITSHGNITVKHLKESKAYDLTSVAAVAGSRIEVPTQLLYGGKKTDVVIGSGEQAKPIVGHDQLKLSAVQEVEYSVSDKDNQADTSRGLTFFVAGILIIVVLLASVLARKRITDRVSDLHAGSTANLSRLLVRWSKSKLASVMTKSLITIGPGATIRNALDLMVKEDMGSLIVVEGNRPIGILRETDFLKIDFHTERLDDGCSKPVNKLLVADLMTSSVSACPADATIGRALGILSRGGATAILVTEGGRLGGLVTRYDLLRSFDKRYCAKSSPVVEVIVAKTMAEKILSVTKDQLLLDITEQLRISGYAIVTGENGSPVGIVTIRDIIHELNKRLSLKAVRVEHIMTSHLCYVTPGLNIISANHIMVEKKYKRLPVINNKRVIGVVTRETITRALYNQIPKGKK
ncbi:MAG: CBS domain-containing protein [archaeon]